MIFWKMLKNIENQFWASLIVFLSDFEHGVKNDFLRFLKILNFSIFFEKIKTHQIDGFQSMGPSKNAPAYRFHAYKWSYHHISLTF